ncbi:MAG: hypothetical protein H6736_01790 [Alphaproteobacteria bacterium]|nr:hypothetical protein [Alphaproteobacteria bacterium]
MPASLRTSLCALLCVVACRGTPTPPVTPVVSPVPVDPPVVPPERPDCSAVAVGDGIVACEVPDECGAEDLEARSACCACDPVYCRSTALPLGPDESPRREIPEPWAAATSESCSRCHQGAVFRPFDGPGIADPHRSDTVVACTTCHGGDGTAPDAADAHVPVPPELRGDDPGAVFGRRTLASVEGLAGWEEGGRSHTALDWVQFVNPGDLRVVGAGRGCGTSGCHDAADGHVAGVTSSPMATNAGIYRGLAYGAGITTEGAPLDAEHGYRGIVTSGDDGLTELLPFPGVVPVDMLAADMPIEPIVPASSDLAALLHTGADLACGSCHIGSAPASPSAGEHRASGCTACHFPYAEDGRTRGLDPHVERDEPVDPDALATSDRAHPRSHAMASIATYGSRRRVADRFCTVSTGIPDAVCEACHTGSNGTALQARGLRRDPAGDVSSGLQYPANPVSFALSDLPGVLAFEDYDGDGRDDTPPDVHTEAGMGCIDCHGSRDVHALGTDGIASHQGQVVGVTCSTCHGTIDAFPGRTVAVDLFGNAQESVPDVSGEGLRNTRWVGVQGQQHLQLTSRVTGRVHWVPLLKDLVDGTSNRTHPVTGEPLFSENASFAMGRSQEGFTHTEDLECAACHASWTNTCMGCHLTVTRDDDPSTTSFSSTNGARVPYVYDEQTVYASPVLRTLTVGERGRITVGGAGEKLFFRYRDGLGDLSATRTFSDRAGLGGKPVQAGRNPFPALGHDATAAHSIRGRPTPTAEGVVGCPACHLTTEGLAGDADGDGTSNAADYALYRDAYLTGNDFDALVASGLYPRLQTILGANPGNTLNHPIYVAANAGLGSALFLFDADGCPVNPLDPSANRPGCAGAPPQTAFVASRVAYDLDRIVQPDGIENASTRETNPAPILRDGALRPDLAGPLGLTLVERLTNPDSGIVLDTWLDADGVLHP